MASSFELTLVNGLAGDPAVCLYFRQTGESLLFDAGDLSPMSNRELLKVKVVAITHTHVDHFIGFDRLIRVNVPHFRTLEVVGPEGIIKNIQGKLAGYTWNLLEPGQVNFIVHEVKNDGCVETVQLSNSTDFDASNRMTTNAHAKNENKAIKIPLKSSDYSLHAIAVDHGIPVLSYCLSMPDTMAVNKTELSASGLTPGPWISDLQKMAGHGEIKGLVTIDGKHYEAAHLADQLLHSKSGERLVYVTDMIFSEANVRRLKQLCDSAPDLVVCEANYRQEHRQKAYDKFHLTTIQAAFVGALLGARNLQIFHVSNVYAGDTETSQSESLTAFARLTKLSSSTLWEEASMEFVSSQ